MLLTNGCPLMSCYLSSHWGGIAASCFGNEVKMPAQNLREAGRGVLLASVLSIPRRRVASVQLKGRPSLSHWGRRASHVTGASRACVDPEVFNRIQISRHHARVSKRARPWLPPYRPRSTCTKRVLAIIVPEIMVSLTHVNYRQKDAYLQWLG